MAAGKKLGTVFTELGLDSTEFNKAQQKILVESVNTARKMEENWRQLGSQSDLIFNAQKKNIIDSYNAIVNNAKSSSAEIIRAEQAKNEKIQSLNDQQFGKQTSFIDSLKQHWVAASAAIVAAWMLVNKAMAYMDVGAKALQVESSFKIMADAAGVNSESLIASMKAATKETIEDSDLMQKAVKLMTLGYNPEQIERFSKVVITASQIAGTTATEAYEGLADAIANRMPKALVRMGAVTKEQMKIVNEAIAAGADSTALYELAMANLEMKQLMLQGTQDAATISLQRFHAQQKETGESIGKFLIVALQKAYGGMQWIAAGALGAASGLSSFLAAIVSVSAWISEKSAFTTAAKAHAATLREYAESLKKTAEDLSGAAGELAAKGAANISGLAEVGAKATAQQIADSKAKIDAQMKELAAFKDTGEAAKKALQEREAAEKAIIEVIRKANLEIEGIGQSQYEKDIARINSEAEKWQDAGANRVNIEKATVVQIEVLRAKLYAKNVEEFYKSEEKAILDNYEVWKKTREAEAKGESDRLELYAKNAQSLTESEEKAILLNYENWKKSKDEEAKYLEGWDEKQLRMEMKLLEDKADFYSKITGYEDEYRKNVFAWIDKEEKRRADMYKDEIAAAKWARDEKIKFDANVTQNNLKNIQQGFRAFADTFEDLSSLYAEDSRQRKTLHDISMAFNVAEKAALAVQAVEAAVVAIATQGSGDPYSAFFRIATMAAAMASLLASAGIAFKGGGGGGGGTTATAATPTLPASTVLGAVAGTGSESISKAYELLGKWHDLEYKELWGIHSEMKALNANISGLVTSIVRTGGFSAIPISTESTMGAIQSQWEQTVKAHYFEGYEKLGDPIIIGLTKALNNWISTGIGKVFGGGIERTLAATGIATAAASIKDLLTVGGGIGAQAYARVAEKHEGGMFSKDWMSSYTEYYELVRDKYGNISNLLDDTFKKLGSILVKFAEGFGTDTQAAYDYIFEATEINLKDMNAEEINKTLSEYFSKIGDIAVETLFGDMLMGYQEINEGLFETATRLLSDKVVVLGILEMTNKAFTGTTSQAIEFSEALIKIAGDFEKLQESAQTYYEAFFSEAEKQERLETQLMGAMEGLNLTLPSTRAGYRALVEGLDLTTTAGMEAYVAMLDMAGAADKYYSTLEDSMEATSRASNNLSTSLGSLTDTLEAQMARVQAAWGGAPITTGHALGGLTSGISIAGESGPEWIVPTYEPQRSSFLRDVGADPEAIGKSIAKHLGNNGRVIHFTWSGNIISADKSPSQLAKEIVRPLKAELRRLEAIGTA